MPLRVLDDQRAAALAALCESYVPGSGRVGPVVYIDALLARMPDPVREMTLGAIDSLADVAEGGPEALGTRYGTPEFFMVRALAVEAYYSDFVAPGAPGPGAWEEIDFSPPIATRVKHDWSYLGVVS